jgi:hypothetical protein
MVNFEVRKILQNVHVTWSCVYVFWAAQGGEEGGGYSVWDLGGCKDRVRAHLIYKIKYATDKTGQWRS